MSDVMIVGSISEGTLREEDLIPAFLSALEEMDSDAYDRISAEYAAEIADPGAPTENHAWLVHSLFDALNEACEDGFYFSAHDNDPACFGIWPVW